MLGTLGSGCSPAQKPPLREASEWAVSPSSWACLTAEGGWLSEPRQVEVWRPSGMPCYPFQGACLREAPGERWAQPWSVTECAPLGWGGGPSRNFRVAPLSLGLWKGKAALRAGGTLPRQWAKHLHVNDKCLWRITATSG